MLAVQAVNRIIEVIDFPRFSVIIPTFNRANLLPFAIKSVLNQTFGDFELIISNGGSTDTTSEAVHSFNDPRIRYIDAKSRLSAGDNYQQGLDAARGEFITFLSDDDAYAPHLLEFVNRVQRERKAQIIGYPYCRYYPERVRELDTEIPKNSLVVPSFIGQIKEFASDEALKQVFRMSGLNDVPPDPRFVPPYLSNAVYESSVFEAIRKVSPKVFKTVPPDEYLTAAVFMVGVSYHCVDVPLLVWSSWTGNMTINVGRDRSGIRQHYEMLLDGRELRFTPLKFALPINCGINAQLEAADDFNLSMQINWKRYFVFMYEYLKTMEIAGVDTSKELREFELVLSKQKIELQRAVRSQIAFSIPKSRALLKKLMPSVAAAFRKMRNPGMKPPTIMSGDVHGFSNVYEAAQHATREIVRRASEFDELAK
jgi:glycosyltransferase involved in cell wall biosynthesis